MMKKYKRLIETDTTILPKLAVEMNYVYLANCTEMKLAEYTRNLDKLLSVIELIENRFGKIIITSAFRCKNWELRMKRSGRSYHAFARAFDFTCSELEKIHDWIQDNIETKELIFYKDRNFIHVAI